jgi:hypothetical protein
MDFDIHSLRDKINILKEKENPSNIDIYNDIYHLSCEFMNPNNPLPPYGLDLIKGYLQGTPYEGIANHIFHPLSEKIKSESINSEMRERISSYVLTKTWGEPSEHHFKEVEDDISLELNTARFIQENYTFSINSTKLLNLFLEIHSSADKAETLSEYCDCTYDLDIAELFFNVQVHMFMSHAIDTEECKEILEIITPSITTARAFRRDTFKISWQEAYPSFHEFKHLLSEELSRYPIQFSARRIEFFDTPQKDVLVLQRKENPTIDKIKDFSLKCSCRDAEISHGHRVSDTLKEFKYSFNHENNHTICDLCKEDISISPNYCKEYYFRLVQGGHVPREWLTNHIPNEYLLSGGE